MKVLVTGGAGFMGSHLVDHLIDQGHKVWVVDNLSRGKGEHVNKQAIFRLVDIRNKTLCRSVMRESKPEIIYHLAAHAAVGQSVFTPKFTFEVNVIGFTHLLTEAIDNGFNGVLVFTSSMDVYGNQPELPMREGHPRSPQDPYGVTKATVEHLLEMYSQLFDFNYVIIRPHNVYGPRQSLTNPYRNVLAIWMNRIMQGKPPIIYGDGQQTRAFTYIDDCTPHLAKVAWTKEAYGEIINIGSEQVYTVNDVCRIVLDKMGSNLEPVYRPERPLEVKHAWCSSEKARRILGYETSTSLEEGVDKMARWVKTVGPQKFDYATEEFEIKRKIPQVWRMREL